MEYLEKHYYRDNGGYNIWEKNSRNTNSYSKFSIWWREYKL